MAERVDPSWQLWYDIYDLVNDDDEIAQEEIDCIMDQAEGYRFQMRCCGCEYILQERNESGLRKLMGWIGSFVTTSNASSVDISTVSMSSAEASSRHSLSQTIAAVWSLPDAAISDEQRAELSKLLSELEKSEGKGKQKVLEVAKRIGNFLFDKCIEAVPSVMPAVIQAIQQAS